MKTFTPTQIWQALEQVKDPEIPVVSVVEMGIVREVLVDGEAVRVTMTPTFSGCPALDVMRREIETAVRQLGITNITVETVLYPPWSTDWISDAARDKLRQFGLAPPQKHGGDLISVAFLDVAQCPRCGSKNTTLKNSFGPTLCRMIYYCLDCQDAFEQFKPL
jgi:ring-1,2-phenylacetyl-CoA epoxidase subunit PaaD